MVFTILVGGDTAAAGVVVAVALGRSIDPTSKTAARKYHVSQEPSHLLFEKGRVYTYLAMSLA